jgi:hypothetical protein
MMIPRLSREACIVVEIGLGSGTDLTPIHCRLRPDVYAHITQYANTAGHNVKLGW